ncbi:unnamed protein product [Phaeothamnion confervicola]
MSNETFNKVVEVIRPHLSYTGVGRSDAPPITPETQLAIAIRYFAAGSVTDIRQKHGVSPAATYECIHRVTKAINRCEELAFPGIPTSEEDCAAAAAGFVMKTNSAVFTKCVGAVVSSHSNFTTVLKCFPVDVCRVSKRLGFLSCRLARLRQDCEYLWQSGLRGPGVRLSALEFCNQTTFRFSFPLIRFAGLPLRRTVSYSKFKCHLLRTARGRQNFGTLERGRTASTAKLSLVPILDFTAFRFAARGRRMTPPRSPIPASAARSIECRSIITSSRTPPTRFQRELLRPMSARPWQPAGRLGRLQLGAVEYAHPR